MRIWDLAVLASNSAIEIDCHIIGRTKEENYTYTKKLSEEMYHTSRDHLDPTKLMILWDTIWPGEKDEMWRMVGDVYLHTNLFARDLACFTDLSKERQEGLKDTCIELSGQSMRYDDSYRRRFLAA
jgi:hypothetical protein